MSLLDKVFAFLGMATYNATPPTAAAAQPTPFQCDAQGRLLVTVAGITSGANVLALPVLASTSPYQIPTPGVVNGYQVSLPFNSAGGSPQISLPAFPLRGMRVAIMDSGGKAAINGAQITDPNGYAIQDPRNPTAFSTPYVFALSGWAAVWEFVTNDPSNGTFWQALRSLQ